ncbi:isocitrate lyase/PEP mutase family protein [Aquincola tertiaricarbonis]|uniref:isocitrate lyase/PEP mutase family protein n=1 Tax=Aquincola tertiaricarbonis TaxID=391953 RepID=UPI000614BD1E|nr:isocitrate lyase/PEP mutase family protein [Aquincola tertiaricarbonis]
MSLTNRQELRRRVQGGPTFWFAGAQDALSALLVDQSGFDGVFSTGFGISASLLGQPDMELYTLSENVQVVDHMANVVRKPIFADADTGYGNVLNVGRTVRAFEKAGVAALSIEDQVSPKRCPAAAAQSLVVPVADAVARVRAAVDARQDPDLLIVARTDVADPQEALDRAALLAEAGADLIQPISRTFSRYEDLVRLREVCGRPLSLQLMEGTWMARLDRAQIESVAAFATYPIVTLLSVVHAMQANLAALSAQRGVPMGELPCGRTTMADFKHTIGWHVLEQRQAVYERPAETAA